MRRDSQPTCIISVALNIPEIFCNFNRELGQRRDCAFDSKKRVLISLG